MYGSISLPTVKPPLYVSPDYRLPPTLSKISVRRLPLNSRKTCVASVQAFADTDTVTESRRSPSLYEILRVKHNASPTEIKTAYRSLAKLYHPDSLQQPESGNRNFIEIHDAYATLSDPAARAMYDLTLEANRRRSFSYGVSNRTRFYQSRRWETDQCW